MRSHAKASTAGSTKRQATGCGHSARLYVALALVVSAVACLAPGAALASEHPFLETFGSAAQPSFGNAEGMAVDQSSGDVLVIDAGAGTVSRYHEDGTPADFSALSSTNAIDGLAGEADEVPGGGGLFFGGASEAQVAVDDSGGATDGNVYVTQGGSHLIDVFASSGAYLGQLTESNEGGGTPFGESCGVAVDPSGNVYVGDFNGAVHKYEPSGSFPVNGDNTLNFAASSPCTLAAGSGPSSGSVFVASYGAAVTKFDATSGEEKYVVSPGANTTVSVNPGNGHVYAASGSEVKEFDASGASSATEVSATSLDSEAQGIAVDETSRNLYATRAGNTEVEVFGPIVHRTHVLAAPFGSAGSGDGQFELAEHSGLAVNDTSHDVYVADSGNHRIDQFDSNGTFIRAFGADVGGAGVDVCTSGCVAGTSGSAPGAFEAPTFIAVDNSGGASNGDVYVGDTGNNVVSKFDAEGTLVSAWGFGGQLDGSTATDGPFGPLAGIAVDSAGTLDVYQAKFEFEGGNVLFKFAEDGTFSTDFATSRGTLQRGLAADSNGNFFKVNGNFSVERFDGTTIGQVSNSSSTTGLAVDASNGELFVDTGTSIENYSFEPAGNVAPSGCTPDDNGPSSVGCHPTTTFGAGDLSAGGGLAVDGASHDLYAADPGAARIVVFASVILPDATTEAASPVGVTSATLHGIVNPEGEQLTDCHFEFVPASQFAVDQYQSLTPAEQVPCVPAAASIPPDSSDHAVSADLSGLVLGTTYHFRLVVATSVVAQGSDRTFTTLGPAIGNETASQINATGARISGEVDPNGEATSFLVQYVSDAKFSASEYAEAASAPVPAAAIPAGVSGSGDLSAATGSGDLAAGFNQVINTTTATGAFAVGQTISGPGIPDDTTITAVTEVAGKKILTLSRAAQSSATGVALTAGSQTISNLTTSAGRFTKGQTISGPGIPPGTTILSANPPLKPTELLISKPETEATEGSAALTASGAQLVTQPLTGLSPDTAYHFRIVASNEAATNQGPDKTFTTLAQPPAGLPDGRAYEMVSPPQKLGEVFAPEPLGEIGGSCAVECLPGSFLPMAPMQASPDGEAVAYEGQPFAGGQASGINEYLASRGPGGWETEGLSSPIFEYEENQGFKAFSADLSRGIVDQISPALSPDAPSSEGKGFANLYLWQGGALEPLVTAEPPQRTPGVRPTETRFELAYGGANAGTALVAPFSHVVFAANDALTEASAFAPEAPQIEAGQRCRLFGTECNLYEWVEGELRLVNVLPGNASTAPRAVIGSRLSGGEPPAVDHAISDDGSRIFWSDEAGQVFVRIDGEETREIEAPGRFLDATPDGSKVLLGQGCLYELETEACEDLTEGEGGFQGILGAAEDLSRIYFVDTKVLSGGEAEEGKPNLYLWNEGAIAYIGTLLADDNSVSDYGAWKPSSARRTAQVSPDGRYLAFMSQASLTGYDNNFSGGGRCKKHASQSPLCKEVFEYDAESGELVCPSCNPGGERPLGESNLSIIKETVALSAAPFPAPHNLTTDGQGRLFFESQDSLSPRDTNGHIQDVYEWEPNGVGSCNRAGGCVYLISAGNEPHDSMFFDSTPSGDDAFIVTRDQLVLADRDDLLDLYDARVGGGIAAETETTRSECQGEACQPAALVPNDATPSSAAFHGAGNLSEKHKHKHQRHKKKHKRHAKKQSHKRAVKTNHGGGK